MIYNNGIKLINELNTGQILSGLDLGERYIGVSISDRTLIIGSPLKIINRKGGKKDLLEIKNLIEEFSIGGFIIGLPLSLNGLENARTKKTRDFAEKLSKNFKISIYLHDERFSTDIIFKELKKNKFSNKKIKKYIDKSAAAYILQGFLDKYNQK